jgi:hypothetical protein
MVTLARSHSTVPNVLCPQRVNTTTNFRWSMAPTAMAHPEERPLPGGRAHRRRRRQASMFGAASTVGQCVRTGQVRPDTIMR